MSSNIESIKENGVARKRRASARTKRNEIFSQENTIAYLNNIVKALRENDICEAFMQGLEKETRYIGKKLGLTSTQCVLLAAIAEGSGGTRVIDNDDLTHLLGVTNLEFMSFVKDIEEMSRMHIVRIVNNRLNNRRCGGNFYMVYEDAMEAIRNDREYKCQSNEGLSPNEVFTRFRILFSEFFDDALTAKRLNEELSDIIRKNQQVGFCKKAQNVYSRLEDDNYVNMFLYMCHRYTSHGQVNIEIERLLMLLNPELDQKRYERDFRSECTPLQRERLIEFASDDGFVNEEEVCLSEEVREGFFTEFSIKGDELPKSPDLKSYESISKKELVYNTIEKEQIQRISKMLDERNLKGVQQRLKEQGMREGINIIFYGAPGTGKTESCLQLARGTGRDILMVDVSKLKDKYVGNSEKQVRGLFRYYRELVKHSEKAPILLFNEADAIFGVRIKNVEHSADKMNNTLQNIILQEMETLPGILIATTNLETNLDPAFERRFLMKVKFEMPDAGAREQIWKIMLPELSEKDAEVLAEKYVFSGGQIENITRKSLINYIIEGSKATMEDIAKYCDEECLVRKNIKKTIGFE